MFYWEVDNNIPDGYFFRNTNGWVIPKTQTSVCLEHQWMPLNGWVGNYRETSNYIKVILMANN